MSVTLTDQCFYLHPARRYLMLRYWNRVPTEVLAHEAAAKLQLPGFVNQTPKNCESYLLSLLTGCRQGKGALSLVVGSAQTLLHSPASGSKKFDPLAWMDGICDTNLSDEEYQKRNKLDVYDTSKDAGKKRVDACVILWTHAQACVYLRAMLLTHKPKQEIAAEINRRWPGIVGQAVRPVDVTSFEELFWDFSGWPLSRRIEFARMYGESSDVAALHTGETGVLFNLGLHPSEVMTLEKLQEEELAQLRIWRGVSLSKAQQYRNNPAEFDAKAYSAAWTTWRAAQDRIVELETERNKGENLGEDGLEIQKAKDFDTYADILARAEQGGVELLVDRVYSAGGIGQEEYEALRQSISEGMMDAATEESLRLWLEGWQRQEEDKRIQRAKGDRVASIQQHSAKKQGRGKGVTRHDREEHKHEAAQEPQGSPLIPGSQNKPIPSKGMERENSSIQPPHTRLDPLGLPSQTASKEQADPSEQDLGFLLGKKRAG